MNSETPFSLRSDKNASVRKVVIRMPKVGNNEKNRNLEMKPQIA